jgi:hypothetical protein
MFAKQMDCRVKPGHDEKQISPAMTAEQKNEGQ